jgi:hypothetical protein
MISRANQAGSGNDALTLLFHVERHGARCVGAATLGAV